MDAQAAFILARALERLAIVFVGGLSIWIGYKLFSQVQRPQTATFKWKDFQANLDKVAPGVFFSLFGCVLLALSYLNLPSFQDVHTLNAEKGKQANQNSQTTIRYAEKGQQPVIEGTIVALNWAIQVSELGEVDKGKLEQLKQGKDYYIYARDLFLRMRLGEDGFEEWSKNRDTLEKNPASLSEPLKTRLEKVRELYNRLEY